MPANSERILVTPKEVLRPNEIPSVAVYGKNLPEAWETAVLACWEWGAAIPTEYDQEMDPDSRDVSLLLTVSEPFSEPRIHRELPCGLDDLYVYTQEVVAGVHDNRVVFGDEGWSYSYHDRLKNWPGLDSGNVQLPPQDQLESLLQKLSEAPHSRRAQAITWFPPKDAYHHEPPCLQRIWGRIVSCGNNEFRFEMNTHWRSRDALKAAFMNMYALTELQRLLAEEISQRTGRNVVPGRYTEAVDSFHLYGSYIRRGEIEGFLHRITSFDLSRRTYNTQDSVVQQEFARGKQRLLDEKR